MMVVICNRCGHKKRVASVEGLTLEVGSWYGYHQCGDGKVGDFNVYQV